LSLPKKEKIMSRYGAYEAVIGLEIHAQLITESKAFSSDRNQYGSRPNTHLSPVTLGHPGTLPVVNKEHIRKAVKMGLATDCQIHRKTHYARKNYFYADLPKGYQISQDQTPICTNGHLIIHDPEGNEKRVGIIRIHMEEDSGKSIHDLDPFASLVDLNRAGVPLIEIVSAPELRYPEEAYEYITEMRKIVRYLEICDGNMEEGSLRCDANVSVRPVGQETFGTKVEVKNMNSMSNVRRALEHEIERQIEIVSQGGQVEPDTRGYDAPSGTTFTMRSKEMANDYRYFPEPDLPPLALTDAFIEGVRAELPELPYTRRRKFVEQLGLNEYDASLLSYERRFADYFEAILEHIDKPKAAANWMNGPIRSYLNDQAIDIRNFPVPAQHIAEVIKMIEADQLNFSAAQQKLFPQMLESPEAQPSDLAREYNLLQTSDADYLMSLIRETLEKYPDKVEAYRKGKKNLIGMFMGEVMRESKGKADPKKTKQMLQEALEEESV
jgi:aspartyl-tRNA(Asn)/glutamyl-tRNA(Gln) amidotransferase subunit B